MQRHGKSRRCSVLGLLAVGRGVAGLLGQSDEVGIVVERGEVVIFAGLLAACRVEFDSAGQIGKSIGHQAARYGALGRRIGAFRRPEAPLSVSAG
jgi:hypothetical protein